MCAPETGCFVVGSKMPPITTPLKDGRIVWSSEFVAYWVSTITASTSVALAVQMPAPGVAHEIEEAVALLLLSAKHEVGPTVVEPESVDVPPTTGIR